MKRKAGISLTVALLMVVSTFTVGAFNVSTNETYPFGDIVKEVFDGENWVDSIEAEIGDTLRFRINVTYYKTDHENATYVKDITIVDTLPACLEFADSAVPEETDVTGQVITWEIEGILHDGGYVVIEFNATVVDYTDSEGEDNIAEVEGNETCSGRDLYSCDFATVIVEEETCVPGIEVIKKVKNAQGEWDEYLGDLLIGDFVDFKIDVVYNTCDLEYTLLNAIIKDELPCCLEFNETLDISSTGPFMDMPTEEVTNNNKTVYWNWTQDESFRLYDGDVLTIEFRAEFVNYCEETNDNWVYVTMWGCTPPGQEPLIFEGEDNATVDCDAPDIEFNKLVWNDHTKHWVEEIETNQDAILTFGLGLTYYGDGYIYDIKFKDVLPCILEYADNAYMKVIKEEEVDTPIEVTNISEDGKTLYFNLADLNIYDGESVGVFFDVLVNGTTGNECCECEFVENWGYVTFDKCGEEPTTMSDNVTIRSGCNCPPTIPVIKGPHAGKVGEELEFTMVSDDESGNITYYYNFGDLLEIITLEDQLPGVEVEISHTYITAGTYYITAMAEDVHGATSEIPDGFGFEVIITEDDEEESVGICLKRIYIGRVSATIKNNMEEALTDVGWGITLTGGFLGRVDVSGNCTIDELAAGGSQKVYSSRMVGAGSVKFTNFGKVEGEVVVNVDGETYTKEFDGFVLGKLVLITS